MSMNSSDDQVVRASASGAVDSGLIPSRVKAMILKLLFTAFLLRAQHYRDNVETGEQAGKFTCSAVGKDT